MELLNAVENQEGVFLSFEFEEVILLLQQVSKFYFQLSNLLLARFLYITS